MAARKSFFCLLSLFSLIQCVSGSAPPLETVELWAKNITKELIAIDDRHIEELKMGFDKASFYQSLNGSEILNQMAQELAALFGKKVGALRSLRDSAEREVANYTYDSDIKMTDVKYINMKDIKDYELLDDNRSRFKQSVSFNASGVHIPLEIYEGYPKILNGLKWSEALDDIFKKNWRNNTDIAWQFFGSKEGFMRVYPANRWKNIPNIPDLYDVRRRPWYIQGSTSPKDMLILMDVSGSVHGQTFEIMKKAVKTLLNTLEEDDYVNVLWFSDKVGFVTCFTKFVQANSRNKKVLFEGIDDLKAAQMANYANALRFAFEHFNNFSETKKDYEGAECSKIIMFFTDGGTEKPNEVIAEYNQDKQFRIFTYAVGPHANPVHTIKSMACENRGYFYTISAMGAVGSLVQHYPNVLARPMALADNKVETYSTVYTDAGGLGMVITVTLPVYNRSEESGNQTTVGVVGIDTPVGDIARVMPKDKTGPNSYVFAINQNGFVILHPRMNAERGYHSYLEDAPDIDLLDLENNDPSQEAYIDMLRKDMINEKTGSKQYRTFVNTGDEYHIIEKNMTYYFTPIENTSISLGIAIAEDRKVFIRVKGNEYGFPKKLNISTDGIMIAPWSFCPQDESSHSTNGPVIKTLLDRLKNNKISDCNLELLQRLHFDINQTQKFNSMMEKALPVLAKYKSSVFIGTDGGLLRIFPKNQMDTFTSVRNPYKATYFKKALYYPRWAFFVSNEIKNNQSGPSIIAAKAIETFKKHKPAVYGMQFKAAELNKMLKDMSGKDGIGCNDLDNTVCYILDDGGYIIISNQDDYDRQKGMFLGDEDTELMWHLNMRNDSIYKRRLEYDYHAICIKTEQRVSSAPTIRNLLKSFFHMLMDAIMWLSLWGSGLLTDASGEVGVTVKTANYSCTKVRTLYYPHQRNQDGKMDNCNLNYTCSREFRATKIQETNLILVVATAKGSCQSIPCEVILTKHKPENTDGPDACAMESRYRKRRNRDVTCFANNTLEDTSDCTSGISVSSALRSLSLGTLTVVAILWKSQQ